MTGDSTWFYEEWQRHLGWTDPRYYFGFGFGADINGLAEQAEPRGAEVKNKVSYPFTGINGIRIDKQVSGKRTYDINVDGVSHYGLYPDWVEDLRKIGGSENGRSEEHTSELQSLMRISYAVFCLKKKKKNNTTTN